MKSIILAAVAALSVSVAAPAFAGCEWGQRSTCVDSDRPYDNKAKSLTPEQKAKHDAANANRQVNDLGGVRRG